MTEQYLVEHQSRDREPTAYEVKLAGVIEEVFATGVHDLNGLVGGLNERGVRGADGQRWTEESFRFEMERLGA